MGFQVAPGELAGFSMMMKQLADPLGQAENAVLEHGSGDMGGLLGERLSAPLGDVAQKLVVQLANHRAFAYRLSDDVNQAAWQYWDDEHGNQQRYGANTPKEPLPGAAPYPCQPAQLELKDSELPDPDSVAEDLDGLAGVLDDLCGIAGAPLFGSVLKSLLGDWRVLDKAGITLYETAKPIGTVFDDVRAGQDRVRRHWEGDAADRFNDLVTRHTNALDDQAAVHRLLGRAYRMTAKALSEVAKKAVEKIGEAINDFLGDRWWKVALKLALRSIPILGQIITVENVISAVRAISRILDEARRIFESFLNALTSEAIGAVQSYLAGLSGEKVESGRRAVEFANKGKQFFDTAEKYAEKYEDLKKYVNEVRTAKEIIDDVNRLAGTPHDMAQAPHTGEILNAGNTREERRRDTR